MINSPLHASFYYCHLFKLWLRYGSYKDARDFTLHSKQFIFLNILLQCNIFNNVGKGSNIFVHISSNVSSTLPQNHEAGDPFLRISEQVVVVVSRKNGVLKGLLIVLSTVWQSRELVS